MGKSFLFVSGKGGVGKSTLAAALAVAAVMKGKRVALVDGDIGLRSLDLQLGMQDHVLYDMADLVSRRCNLNQALIWHKEYPSLCLMVGGQQAKPKDFKKQDLKKIINTLKKRFDLVLIDGPAGLGRGVNKFTGVADEVVVVTTPDPVSVRSAEKLISILYPQGVRPSLLLNRQQGQKVLEGSLHQASTIAQSLDLPLLGAVEENPLIYSALIQGKTAAQTGDLHLDAVLNDILSRMDGVMIPVPDYQAKPVSALARFFQKLGF